jgi:voltage-gated potassium channel
MSRASNPAELVRAAYRGLLFIANSVKLTVSVYLVLLVSGAFLYWLFEDNKTVGDSLWWSVVTASTVGYGDTYPETTAGRIVAGILISLMVLVVIPLITAHFASKLIVDSDAFHHDEQEEIKANIRAIREAVERLEAQRAADRAVADAFRSNAADTSDHPSVS